MTGSKSTTSSPSTVRTMRKTPWVAGCCGPTLKLTSIVSSSRSMVMSHCSLRVKTRSFHPSCGFQSAGVFHLLALLHGLQGFLDEYLLIFGREALGPRL